MRSGRWRPLVRIAIVVGVFPLMVVDEIIGKYQFEALCKGSGIENVDVSKARGKRVKLEVVESKLLKWTMVPIKERERLYKDADTGEVLIYHKRYVSSGGWLMRYTPLSMGWPRPILFYGSCGDNYSASKNIFSINNITLIN
jgi:hypothetical protein